MQGRGCRCVCIPIPGFAPGTELQARLPRREPLPFLFHTLRASLHMWSTAELAGCERSRFPACLSYLTRHLTVCAVAITVLPGTLVTHR